MTKALLLLVAVAAFGLQVSPARAQLARTFVSSVNGNDANNCSQATPCRTFQAAHDNTFDQGEITVLDPGGYGTLTIRKSISVVNDGVGEAGVLVSGGAVGIEVAALNAYVNLRGITVNGTGAGTGLRLDNAFALTITNCVFRNLTGNGIEYRPNNPGSLTITDTLIADNGGSGILVKSRSSGAVAVSLGRVEMYNNSQDGFTLDSSEQPGSVNAAITDSVAANNFGAGFANRGTPPANAVNSPLTGQGQLMVTRSVSSNNNFGFFQDQNNVFLVVGESIVGMNFDGARGGTAGVFTYQDNYSFGNSGNGNAFVQAVSKQ